MSSTTSYTNRYNTPGALLVENIDVRNTGILHRSNITAVDKIAVPATPIMSGVTITSGSLVSGTSYNCTIAAINQYGPTTVSANVSGAPGGSNNAQRVTPVIPSGLASTDKIAFFLSTDANPKWVCEFTVAQIQSGGFQCIAVGVVSAGSSPVGTVDIGIVGTGVASNVAPFTVNKAYNLAGIAPFTCVGYQQIKAMCTLSVASFKSTPTYGLVAFYQENSSPNGWFIDPAGVTILTPPPMKQQQSFSAAQGTIMAVILVDSLTGDTPSITIKVETE